MIAIGEVKFTTSLSKVHKNPLKIVKPQQPTLKLLRQHYAKYVDNKPDRNFGLKLRRRSVTTFIGRRLPSYPT